MKLVNIALAQATKLCKTLQSPADPFPDKPIDVLLDEHEEIIDVYQDYLRSSSGRQLSQFVQMCIKVLITVHSQAAPKKEIYIQQLYNEIEAAQADFQMEQQAKVQEFQSEMQRKQFEEQMQMKQTADSIEQQKNEEAVLNELVVKEASHAQDKAHTDDKQEQQLDFEVAKEIVKE